MLNGYEAFKKEFISALEDEAEMFEQEVPAIDEEKLKAKYEEVISDALCELLNDREDFVK